MAKNAESHGRSIRRLIGHAGLTLDEAAKAMGYRRASSIQRYLEDDYGEAGPLKIELAAKLVKALVGKGAPPIEADEIYGMAGVELTERGTYRAVDPLGALQLGLREVPADGGNVGNRQEFSRGDVFRLPKDLPVYGTVLGATQQFHDADDHDVAVEQTELRTGDVIEFLRRPPHLIGNDQAHVLYLQGSSMEPKFEDGEAILVDPRRPVRARDYVIVTLKRQEAEGVDPEAACVMVKRLVRRTSEFVDLEQFNPPTVFRVPMRKVMRISPVVPWGEAMGF